MVVIGLFLSLRYLRSLFLLSLQSLHDLLSLLILIDHDITDTEVGHNNSCQTKHIIRILIDNWFVVSNGLVISLQNKEHMSHIQLPSLMIRTELRTLSEELLHHSEIFLIPIDLSLRHQDRYVLLEAFIKLFQWLLNTFVVLCQSRILYTFGKLPQCVNIPISN